MIMGGSYPTGKSYTLFYKKIEIRLINNSPLTTFLISYKKTA